MTRLSQSVLGTAVVAVGIVFAFLLVAIAEISVRSLTQVSFQGNSRNLITLDRFNGRTWGNTPNVTALSFGVPIYTDSNGFRVPSLDYRYPETAAKQVLILGDSVAFGPGVLEPDTFIGLLRAANPGWAIYNSSAIGYDTGNEADVVRDLLARGLRFSNVILVYCLNDVSTASAANIETQTKMAEPGSREPVRNVGPAKPVNLTERLKLIGFVQQLNDFLREHSKLFLYLKGTLTDPAQRYFLADYAAYQDPAALKGLDRLEVIANALKRQQISFAVIISPYEYQLRANATLPDGRKDSLLLPQQEVAEFLKSKKIPYVDATEVFKRAAVRDKSTLFLKFDPMHLSVAGHQVMYEVINSVAPVAGSRN